MKLIRFRDYIGKKGAVGQPPATIKAKDLDDNFSALQIKKIILGDGYEIGKVSMESDGQVIRLEGWSIKSLIVCEGGSEKTIKIIAKI